MDIILASTSPRRIQLLSQADVDFQTLSIEIDESKKAYETASDYILRMVLDKAQCAIKELKQNKEPTLILTADTVAVAPDGEILGKPKDKADAFMMWDKLSGKTHTILTAVCATCFNHDQIIAQNIITVQTDVTFIQLTDAQKEKYWQTGEPIDKAGAYAIQGIGGAWVKKINGSYSSVVGLPLAETLALIEQMRVYA